MGTRCSLPLIAIAFAAILLGCSNDDGPVDTGGNNTPTATTGIVSGMVVDIMGQPIPLASITLVPSGHQVTAGADGRFVFGDLAPGRYTVNAAKSGFVSDSAVVQIVAGKVAAGDVEMLETGLVAAYRFAGDANDATGNGHDGQSTSTGATSDRFGVADRAFVFSQGARVDVPHSAALNFGQSFSIGAWVRLDGAQQHYTGLISKGPRGTEHPGYMLLIMEGNVVGTATGQPEYVVLQGSRDLNDGLWHYLTLVTDAASKRVSIYADGNLERSEIKPSLGLFFDTTEPLHIGVERNTVNYFTGAIDDIRIFNRALTPGEVLDLARR
jgi:hypothetical protein